VVGNWWQRLREALAYPRAPWVIAALAVLLLAPALGNGLVLDDFYHREVATHGTGYIGELRAPLDMFNFFPEEMRAPGLHNGLWPWWSSLEQIGFWRPLASATHWLDYQLPVAWMWLAHLHSLLWYALLVLAVGWLFRKTLTPAWVAGLATLLYGLDGGHALPASWLASRNMVLATLFGVLSIGWYVRAEAEHYRPGRWLSPLALALALLSAEFGVSALGYVLAYAVVMVPGDWRRRARSVLPHLAVVVMWQVYYLSAGYGVKNAGLYTHPVQDPVLFGIALLQRGPILLLTSLTLPFADGWLIAPPAWGWTLALLSLLALAGLLWVMRPQLREPTQRWYALGALLAVVPCCTTFPNGRLLMFVGLGAVVLLARLVERMVDGLMTSRAARGLTWALLVRHTLLAAVMLPGLATAPQIFDEVLNLGERSLPRDEAFARQTAVIVNTPHPFLSNIGPVLRRIEPSRGPAPLLVRTLGSTVRAVRVTRIDEHTIEIHAEGGFIQGRLFEIEWNPHDRRGVGFHRDLGDMLVTVMAATADGHPETVRVRFEKRLEDPSLRWVTWRTSGFLAFELPAVGASVTIEAIDALAMMKDASEAAERR
jgi:hypothetical protein